MTSDEVDDLTAAFFYLFYTVVLLASGSGSSSGINSSHFRMDL